MNISAAEQPLISIIMPVYNAGHFLAQTIESVIEQTYSNWELIVVDDRSSDNSAAIANGYADLDRRIKVFINEKNIGAAGTRNKGISQSKGDWIAFLDADDIWREEKLEKQLACADKSGADLIYASYSLLDDNGSEVKRKDYIVPEKITYRSMLRENYIGCSTALIRRSAIKGHRFSESIYHEDYALWLELLKEGCIAAGCTEVLVDWRIRPDSRSADKIHAAKCRWQILRKIEQLPLGSALISFVIYAIRGMGKRYTGFTKQTGARHSE